MILINYYTIDSAIFILNQLKILKKYKKKL